MSFRLQIVERLRPAPAWPREGLVLRSRQVALLSLVWPACTVLPIILAFFAVDPFLESAINDDWTYSRMSQLLVETGRLHFDGWTSAMAGLHVVWGAILIKVFGFSFTILRLSTLATAAGCSLVCQAICRRIGLSIETSGFTAMTLLLSPLAIGLTPTFMTDITGLFLSLVVVYCSLRCGQANTHRAFIGWLSAIVVAGVLGGSVRQVLFLPPISMIVSLVLLRWPSRRVLLMGLSALICTGASAVALLFWQYAQPGSIHGRLHLPMLSAESIRWSARMAALSALTLAGLATPILASALTVPSAWRKSGFLFLPIAGLVFAGAACRLEALLPPWLGNVVTVYGGTPPNDTILGDRPVVLLRAARILFAAAMYLSATLVASVGLRCLRDRFRHRDLRSLNVRDGQGLTLAVIVFPAVGLYCAAFISRCMTKDAPPVFDRYLLPVAGMILPTLAYLHDSLISPRITKTGWAILAFLAGLGIAMTHDEIAVRRAILAATDRLTRAGLPREHVSAGYEYDGWTQLLARGFIDDPARIHKSPYRSRFWFGSYTPVVKGCYYVVLSPQTGLLPSKFEPVQYTAWFSPRQREVLIQRNPDADQDSCRPE